MWGWRIVPFDARAEIEALYRYHRYEDKFIDAMWKIRYPLKSPKAEKEGWPMGRAGMLPLRQPTLLRSRHG
jgi:hypothetical protein